MKKLVTKDFRDSHMVQSDTKMLRGLEKVTGKLPTEKKLRLQSCAKSFIECFGCIDFSAGVTQSDRKLSFRFISFIIFVFALGEIKSR